MLETDLEGILFKTYTVTLRVYPQKEIGRSVKHIMDRTISNKVCFLLYAILFNCGVLVQKFTCVGEAGVEGVASPLGPAKEV